MSAMSRLPGLDLLRCCAIVPVVIYHTPLVNPHLERLGFIGVEIFFALSGFLILQMIVERFDGIRTKEAFAAFMVNRWLRTVPLYWLMLLVYAAVAVHYAAINPQGLPVVGNFATLPPLWPFLIFSQNLLDGGMAWNHGWYGISWSLSVEEWFYLIVPVVLLAFRRLPLTRVVVVFSLGMIAAMLALRAARYLGNGPLHFDDMYRRAVFLRLDAFCYGALCYLAMQRHAAWMASRRRLLFLAGLAILLACYVNAPAPGRNDAFTSIFFLALVPGAFALMIPALYHSRCPALCSGPSSGL